MASAALPLPPALTDDRSFFGHPKGLGYLAFTEAWERFSFYGMRALLVLYLVQELLLPGHVENVAGMAGLRAVLERVYGPLSPQALASLIFGFYGGLVYFTPLLGGWIADRWLGAKRTVLAGVVLMTAGHGAMVFEQSVLIALLLLIIGSGALKGNIAAQVGHLYRPDEETRAASGFILFSMAINIGATLGPLVAGIVAQVYGWHAGFGIAGVFMLLALGAVIAGDRHLPEDRPAVARRVKPAPLTRRERKRVILLLIVLLISIPQSIAYDQVLNVGIVWVDQFVDMATPIGAVPVPWFNSIDAIASVVTVPLVIGMWRFWSRRGGDLSDLAKIGIGSGLTVIACLMLAGASVAAASGKIGLPVPFLVFFLLGFAFSWYWPVMLSLVSRLAPPSINARMVSLVYVTTFASGIIIGSLGTLYEPMGPVAFWLLHAGICATGAAAVLLFGRRINRAFEEPNND